MQVRLIYDRFKTVKLCQVIAFGRKKTISLLLKQQFVQHMQQKIDYNAEW